MSFAVTLQTLRKEAGLTQEQLASKFGVSAQAVSKWENGSFPEGDLIPKIADQFGVSIDYLYGREEKKASLEQQVVRGLNAVWKEEKDHKEATKKFMEKLHRILWAFQIAGWSENPDYFDRPCVAEKSGELDSAILNSFGYSFMRMNQNHEWYLFLKQPDCEEGFLKWFEGAGKIVPMIKLLSDPESVRVLLYMYTLNNHEFAGAETVSKETGISKEKAAETLNKLTSEIGVCNHPLYRISIMKGSGKEETVYGINKTLSGLLLGVVALLDTYCNAADSYSMHINNREESWIKHLPD
ncbi:MAG: helix-turn-helix transcriptional regulator [Lachnospiraceae bacterium]|nr:helix-turn-helix transcriptional regulator [Lachnospiraceae bacterium]